jgi:hypothetical protein
VAAFTGNFKVLLQITKMNPTVVNDRDSCGFNIVHYLLFSNHFKEAKELSMVYGENLHDSIFLPTELVNDGVFELFSREIVCFESTFLRIHPTLKRKFKSSSVADHSCH